MLGILISATECLVVSLGYSVVWLGETAMSSTKEKKDKKEEKPVNLPR